MIERECELNLCAKWLATNSSQLVGEKPAATTNSFLICFNGGIIEPETSGQGPAGVGKSPPLPEEHPALNLLKELFILLNDENLGRFENFCDNDSLFESIRKRVSNALEILMPGSLERAKRFCLNPNLDNLTDNLFPISMLIKPWKTGITSNLEISEEEINNTLIKYALINSGYVDRDFDFAGMNPIKRDVHGCVNVSFTSKEGKKIIVKSFNLVPDYELNMETQIIEMERFAWHIPNIADAFAQIPNEVISNIAQSVSFAIAMFDFSTDYRTQLVGYRNFIPESIPEKTNETNKDLGKVIAIVTGGVESFGTVDKNGKFTLLYSEEIKRK